MSGPESVTGTEHDRSALVERLQDPAFLPTHQQVLDAFGGQLGSEFREYCRNYPPVFDIWTQEYINGLGEYLKSRASELRATPDRPLKIAEVCAGDGRLNHFLGQALEAQGVPATIVATDAAVSPEDNNWGIAPAFPVEQMTAAQAVDQLQPDIVLCSWMPLRVDLTGDFRAQASVDEYILIGEPDCGATGSFATWGVPDEWEEGYVPEYTRDGFERDNLDELSDLQICGNTSNVLNVFTATVSFKRR